MMVLAASPSLAEDGQVKVPGKKDAPDGARGQLSPEMMKRLLEKFDANKDGQLSAEEKANAQAELMKNAAPQMKELIKRFDRNGDGQLDAREQAAAREAMAKIRAQGGGAPQAGAPVILPGNNEIPAAILEKFDKDGDGKLNDKELAAAKKAQGGKRERVKQADVIKEFDKDGDGKLNDEEKAAARKAAKERKKNAE
jgi:Ca2+-binding EF-hand superfamily protein